MCRPGNSASLRYMEELFIPDLPRPPTRHPDGGGAPRRGVAAAVPGYALHRCRNASTLILIDALLSSCLTRGILRAVRQRLPGGLLRQRACQSATATCQRCRQICAAPGATSASKVRKAHDHRSAILSTLRTLSRRHSAGSCRCRSNVMRHYMPFLTMSRNSDIEVFFG